VQLRTIYRFFASLYLGFGFPLVDPASGAAELRMLRYGSATVAFESPSLSHHFTRSVPELIPISMRSLLPREFGIAVQDDDGRKTRVALRTLLTLIAQVRIQTSDLKKDKITDFVNLS